MFCTLDDLGLDDARFLSAWFMKVKGQLVPVAAYWYDRDGGRGTGGGAGGVLGNQQDVEGVEGGR